MAGIQLTGLSSSSNQPLNFTAPVQQVSILETSNPKYPRLLVASNNGVVISRPGHSVGIAILDLIALAAAVDPVIALPPVITLQPVPATVVHPASTSFVVAGTCEAAFTVSYQWQFQPVGTSGFVNVFGAQYSGMTTSTLSISDSTGLNGILYRCILYTTSGSTKGSSIATNSALLTVS